MEHLFNAWPKMAAQLPKAGHVLLLTDYDGTLTPIVERPEQAALPEATRFLLQKLAQERHYTVGIISGRALGDLKALVGLKEVIYAGNHGLEIEGPGLRFIHPVAQEFKAVLQVIYRVLQKALAGIAGVLVENKGLTLSTHYRLVDQELLPEVKNAFERAVGVPRLLGRVKITGGKKVYEVRPAVDWDKGKAISMVMAHDTKSQPRSRPMVIFLGDDLTDEDGFRVVERHGGISIFVGEEPPQTAARYYLRSPQEVQQFLSQLVEAERRKSW